MWNLWNCMCCNSQSCRVRLCLKKIILGTLSYAKGHRVEIFIKRESMYCCSCCLKCVRMQWRVLSRRLTYVAGWAVTSFPVFLTRCINCYISDVTAVSVAGFCICECMSSSNYRTLMFRLRKLSIGKSNAMQLGRVSTDIIRSKHFA